MDLAFSAVCLRAATHAQTQTDSISIGKVIMAFYKGTKIPVALKLSRRALVKSRVSRKGLEVLEDPLREIAIIKKLSNFPGEGKDYIVELYDEIVDEKYHLGVFEFAAGGELFTCVEKVGALGSKRARQIFKQMALGVRFLHRHNVCHLDLSLENILLDRDGRIKICDFGVAREVMPGQVLNAPGSPVERPGKLAYMAPEVFAGKEFDRSADVYTLGVDLFLLLTGVMPYKMPSTADWNYRLIRSGNISRLLSDWKMSHLVSPLCQDLLLKMLAPRAERLTIDQVLSHPWVAGFPPDLSPSANPVCKITPSRQSHALPELHQSCPQVVQSGSPTSIRHQQLSANGNLPQHPQQKVLLNTNEPHQQQFIQPTRGPEKKAQETFFIRKFRSEGCVFRPQKRCLERSASYSKPIPSKSPKHEASQSPGANIRSLQDENDTETSEVRQASVFGAVQDIDFHIGCMHL